MMNLADLHQNNKVQSNKKEGLTDKELSFMLALINDHTFSGLQLEMAYGIKIKIKLYLEYVIQENAITTK